MSFNTAGATLACASARVSASAGASKSAGAGEGAGATVRNSGKMVAGERTQWILDGKVEVSQAGTGKRLLRRVDSVNFFPPTHIHTHIHTTYRSQLLCDECLGV